MLLTTTFKLLRKADACMSSYRKLREALIDTTNEEPINLLTILEVLGLKDALWALRATEQNCDKAARLMAADFAEELLPRWIRIRPTDTRPADAIQAARNFAGGLISAEQSTAASYAASASYATSSSASQAASYASSSAAYAAYYAAEDSSASYQRQEQIFRSYLQA